MENELKYEKYFNKKINENLYKLYLNYSEISSNIKNIFNSYKSYLQIKNKTYNEFINFIREIEQKEKQINEIIVNSDLSNNGKLISVIFISMDDNIHKSYICKNDCLFNQLENLLYFDYPEYKDIKNIFKANGNLINKFQNLKYNKIKDNDIIILYNN